MSTKGMLRKVTSGLCMLASISAISLHASELDLALSKETAAVELLLDTNAISNTQARFEVGGLYNENDDLVGYLGLASGGEPGTDQAYAFGVGARLYYGAVDTPDVNVGALALGVSGKIKFSAGMPLALAGDFHYAPKITTFSDGDEVLDTRVRLETDISPSATAFVGYRNLQFGLKSHADYDIDDFVHLGVRFSF